ncbi:MAG: multi-sensor signal transduction histidine kinase [Hyphomicrobiales bacterium]|nr:multi-sensor signal transduction histidine kinase [Hyphomicrobiales bacterium]
MWLKPGRHPSCRPGAVQGAGEITSGQRRGARPILAAILALVIFALDTFYDFDIAIAVLYVVVVLMSLGFCKRRGVLAVAAGCAALTVLAFLIQHKADPTGESTGRLLVSLAAIAITSILAIRIEASVALLRAHAALLDLPHDAIFVRSMDDIVTYWNRGAENLYGWSEREAIGNRSVVLTGESNPDEMERAKTELLNNGYWEGERFHAKRDGSPVPVASRWSLQRDESGLPSFILESNTDIGERKRAQDSLAHAQAEVAHVSRVSILGELMASIAHEISQPLAAIVTGGEASLRWLQIQPPQIEEVRLSVERMIGDGRRAGEVVRHLRSLARKDDVKTETVDINETIEDAIDLLRREIALHRVCLKLDLETALPQISGDRIQLQQVFINIIMNSIQAMANVDRERRLVVISRAAADETLVVAISDTGAGFDPVQEQQLFDAFFSTKPDGLGMGLAISRSIIEAHDGRISAARNASTGATFRIILSTRVDQS